MLSPPQENGNYMSGGCVNSPNCGKHFAMIYMHQIFILYILNFSMLYVSSISVKLGEKRFFMILKKKKKKKPLP